jgi:alpha-L-fucosidase
LRFVLLALIAAVSVSASSSVGAGVEYPELPLRLSDETEGQKAERMSWWTDARFGMFVHFGLYSVPGRHEWIQSMEAIAPDEYARRYMPRFNPDLYDAKEWIATAKAAGMRYVVLTAKHHEGFCMWDTETTDFKITNTSFGRDVVREFVDACREAGLGVGFYFSLKDWHSRDFTLDETHPETAALRRRGLSGAALRAEVDKANKGRDMDRFRAFMFAQVRELLTRYGKIDIIWYDYTHKDGEFPRSYKDWDAVALVKLTRELQPSAIIDNRLDLMDTDDGWDFLTPEQFKVQSWPTVRGRKVPWETCQTFSGSWGYHRDEETWKSVPQLVELLVHSVSMGGNLILNVGPTARGEFDARAKERLRGIGEWMHFNSRAIYGCGPAPEGFAAPSGTALTFNEKTDRLYLHLYDYPMGFLPLAFLDRVEYAQFLHDGSELKLVPPARQHPQSGEQHGELGGITLPVVKPSVEVPVVEMWLKRKDTEA